MLLVLTTARAFRWSSGFDGVGSSTSATCSTFRDFSFTDIRQDAGVGLRVRTPWFLLRGDYGVALRSETRRAPQPLLLQHRPSL